MSGYQQRDMTGSLFKNEKKEQDNHPDYKGDCLIDGQAYWMSAWLKTSESGRKWMSFSFKAKESAQKTPSAPPKTHGQMKREAASKGTGFDDMDDDIPF